jgi:hypothetical protein
VRMGVRCVQSSGSGTGIIGKIDLREMGCGD